ncbi:hypothetical protein ONS95_008155 [Cadophora gregata]|uniref:uncharacterized protein n=1 Tax=Cadophora gregata TaxID=51156 RepID=UPI0026DD1990|nr:uncharacterized protein ONS95_008155 [Cadophora gregata]KAK0119311.1 hypothetical protein ONS96_012366 [Cadophora gregata f. sp. sojae]KAK0126566.1 hypothetical protein ONS95_008155 [Cadophora gregata]
MIRWTSRYFSIWLRASVLGLLIIFGYLCFYSRSAHGQPLTPSPENWTNVKDSTPGANIVVSVKTGASEAAERIPIQMQTSLRDVQNVFFFSDLEQDLGQYHLYDSLDTIKPSIMQNNPDFVFYQKQREMWNATGNITSLKNEKHPDDPSELAAWTLDKYKDIHILEKTWALMPDQDWYIFIDADTYLLWSNVVQWLSTLDPKKKSYFGSEVNASGVKFAHGGTGIIISKATMYNLAVRDAGLAAGYDSIIHNKCCGDLVLGMALRESGTLLQDAWPAMSGEAPWTMPFGLGTPEYWCQPALTLHHLSPDGMAEFTAFEDKRENKLSPLIHEEMFNKFVLDLLVSQKDNWDNLASERGEFGKTGGVTSDTSSFEDCRKACEADKKCFQYSHHGNICNIGMSVRLGYKKDADSEGIWRSGWNLTRLQDWASKQERCGPASFPKQNN